MVYKYVAWKDAEQIDCAGSSIVVPDSTLLVGGIKDLNSYQASVLDHMTTEAVPNHVMVIPDFVYLQSDAVLYYERKKGKLSEWKNNVNLNQNVRCFMLGTGYFEARKDGTTHTFFENMERRLPDEWKHIAASIPHSKSGEHADKAVIYTGLYLNERFPENKLLLVSDDRNDIYTARVWTKLRRYKKTNIELLKTSAFLHQLRKKKVAAEPRIRKADEDEAYETLDLNTEALRKLVG